MRIVELVERTAAILIAAGLGYILLSRAGQHGIVIAWLMIVVGALAKILVLGRGPKNGV